MMRAEIEQQLLPAGIAVEEGHDPKWEIIEPSTWNKDFISTEGNTLQSRPINLIRGMVKGTTS